MSDAEEAAAADRSPVAGAVGGTPESPAEPSVAASVDLEAETRVSVSVARTAGADLEEETQLSVSAARSGSVDLEAETQLTVSVARSGSVDLEAETLLADSVRRSARVGLEAETQPGDIDTAWKDGAAGPPDTGRQGAVSGPADGASAAAAACSGLGTESDTQEGRIELPSTQEVTQVSGGHRDQVGCAESSVLLMCRRLRQTW